MLPRPTSVRDLGSNHRPLHNQNARKMFRNPVGVTMTADCQTLPGGRARTKCAVTIDAGMGAAKKTEWGLRSHLLAHPISEPEYQTIANGCVYGELGTPLRRYRPLLI